MNRKRYVYKKCLREKYINRWQFFCSCCSFAFTPTEFQYCTYLVNSFYKKLWLYSPLRSTDAKLSTLKDSSPLILLTLLHFYSSITWHWRAWRKEDEPGVFLTSVVVLAVRRNVSVHAVVSGCHLVFRMEPRKEDEQNMIETEQIYICIFQRGYIYI